jgi:hypothetical protein
MAQIRLLPPQIASGEADPARIWPPLTLAGYTPETEEKADIGRRIGGGQIHRRPNPVAVYSNRLGGAFPLLADPARIWPTLTPAGYTPEAGEKADIGR